MSRCRPGSPWSSLATRFYHPLLLWGLRGYNLYRHRAVVYCVLTGRPAFACRCEGGHRSISLMSSSLFLLQCLAYLVRLTWKVFVMGVRWLYSCFFCEMLPTGLVQFCLHHSCVIACKLFSIGLVTVHEVHPYSSIRTTAAWKKLRFILSVWSDFQMTDSLSVAVHAFASPVVMSFLVNYHCFPGLWTCPLVSKWY